MAALLVALSVMAVLMTAVMPVWHHMAQREREEEWVFRGRQYARAILPVPAQGRSRRASPDGRHSG